MITKQDETPKVTPSNTKKEILEAYHQLKKQHEEKAKQELRPEKKKEERQVQEATVVAEETAAGSIAEAVGVLRNDINAALSDIDAKIEEQVGKYIRVKEAITAKEKELAEIFDIERSAYSLAALLEAQKQKRESFEQEMTEQREKLELEIEKTREAWEDEQAESESSAKEQKEQREKKRRREQEEYDYKLKREREKKTNALQDEIDQLEKEVAEKEDVFEKKVETKEMELKERETVVAEEEARIASLEAQVEKFPKELEETVRKAVNETTDRLGIEAAKHEELLQKTFEGEKNVLASRIESFEQITKEQKKQLELLTAQLEKAYNKVQDIAVKAVEGSRDRFYGDAQSKASSQND